VLTHCKEKGNLHTTKIRINKPFKLFEINIVLILPSRTSFFRDQSNLLASKNFVKLSLFMNQPKKLIKVNKPQFFSKRVFYVLKLNWRIHSIFASLSR